MDCTLRGRQLLPRRPDVLSPTTCLKLSPHHHRVRHPCWTSAMYCCCGLCGAAVLYVVSPPFASSSGCASTSATGGQSGLASPLLLGHSILSLQGDSQSHLVCLEHTRSLLCRIMSGELSSHPLESLPRAVTHCLVDWSLRLCVGRSCRCAVVDVVERASRVIVDVTLAFARVVPSLKTCI